MQKIIIGFILLVMLLQTGCRLNRPGVEGSYMNDPGEL